jgi:hypothetical protein
VGSRTLGYGRIANDVSVPIGDIISYPYNTPRAHLGTAPVVLRLIFTCLSSSIWNSYKRLLCTWFYLSVKDCVLSRVLGGGSRRGMLLPVPLCDMVGGSLLIKFLSRVLLNRVSTTDTASNRTLILCEASR